MSKTPMDTEEPFFCMISKSKRFREIRQPAE